LGQAGQGFVLAHVHPQHESLELAVLRHEAHAKANGVARATDADGATFEQDLATVQWVSAEQDAYQLRAAGAHQSGQTEDLAATQHEADVLERAFARSEEHTSELQSRGHLVCRLLLEKKKKRGISKGCVRART